MSARAKLIVTGDRVEGESNQVDWKKFLQSFSCLARYRVFQDLCDARVKLGWQIVLVEASKRVGMCRNKRTTKIPLKEQVAGRWN